MLELQKQFLCFDVTKFIEELQRLIDKYTSDSQSGLDVTVDIKSYN